MSCYTRFIQLGRDGVVDVVDRKGDSDRTGDRFTGAGRDCDPRCAGDGDNLRLIRRRDDDWRFGIHVENCIAENRCLERLFDIIERNGPAASKCA